MKTLMRIAVLLAAVAAAGLPGQSRAELVIAEEARIVAENYVKLIIEKDGSWGGRESAEVVSVEPFQRGDIPLGYYCEVEPVGYLIISLYDDLAPIRAYSYRSDLNPNETTGMSEMLKVRQEMIHGAVEARLGRQIDPAESFRHLLPKQFDEAWRALTDPSFDALRFRQVPKMRDAGMDYQEGEELLRTTWNQPPPYNDQCPLDTCEWPGHGYYNDNAHAGCVAVAGAQICKYWNWPPEGTGNGYDVTYDWPNMAESYRWNAGIGWFESRWDGQWYATTLDEIDAVALIVRKVGVGANSNYGCDETGAFTEDLKWVLPGYFRYDYLAESYGYQDHSYSAWWAALRSEFDNNRPVAYKIPGHALVADGYRIELGEDQIHVVYGHNGSNDGWCAVTEVPGAEHTDDEAIVRYIVPECVIGTPREDYPLPDYPYRYFERDFESAASRFAPGHNLPILRSGLLMTCIPAGPTYDISFEGEPGLETLLYLNGDPEVESRILISDGAVKIYDGGQLAVY